MAGKEDNSALLIGIGLLILFNAGKGNNPDIAPGHQQQLSPDEFIKKYGPLAQMVQTQFGIPADSTLGESGLESGWGNSGLVKNANNYFAIQEDRSWKGETYTPGTDPNNAPFRKYASAEESFLDYGKFLTTNSRYKPAFAANTTDPVQFSTLIAQAGYAEDPDYQTKLTQVVSLVQKINV